MMQSKDMFLHWNLYWNTFFFKSLLRKVEIWQLFPFCVNAFQQIKCKSSRGKNSHFAGSSIFFVFLLWFHQYLHWISFFVDFIVLMIHKVKFLLRCNIFINIKIDMIIVHELTFFFLTFHPQMEANEYSRMNSKWRHFLCWKRLSMFKGKNIRNNFRSYLHQVLFFIYFFLFWKTLLFRIPHTLKLWKNYCTQGNICLHFIFALCPRWQWSNLDWANSNVSNFLSFNTTVSGRTEDVVK